MDGDDSYMLTTTDDRWTLDSAISSSKKIYIKLQEFYSQATFYR